nr:reverse transcriptase domain-containing protein [Tanacetum cinerariifolium]
MADRTMEELPQAPTEGEAIVIPEILAENFEIKTNLLLLVQANKFHGRENDNPHTHISNFKRMTATLKYRDVSNDAIKLMLFPYSLEDRARIWYEKEPPNSILTWDDLVNKFVNQFYPPSKTTHLKNEISHFSQRFEETFNTFYNGLTEQDQDSLNTASGGNLLNKTTREALKIMENKSKISNLVEIVNKQVIAPAKAVEKTCVTCGGAHDYYECIAPIEENLRRNLKDDMSSILGSFFQNQPSTSGTLPSNTVPNPKGEIKAVTNRSGLAYEGPSIPTESLLEKVDEQNTEEILDKEHYNSSGSTAQVQLPVVPISIPETDVLRTQTKPTILYPSRLNDQKLQEKATNQMEKFFQIFHDLHFDISFADALLLMPKFASTFKSLLANKDKLFELAKGWSRSKSSSNLREVLLKNQSCFNRCIWRGNYPQEVVHDNTKSSNHTLVSKNGFCEELIVKTSPFGESDFFSEEIENFLKDDPIPAGIENSFMGYEPFITTLVMELDEVVESSANNLVPISSEYEVTSDNESEFNEPIKDDSFSAFTTFKNPLFNNKDDFTIHDDDVPIEESKVYLNPLFDDDDINSDELGSHVESNFVETLSNHDSLKFDHLEEFSGALIPNRIAEEERIKREHAKYIIQDNVSQREEIDIVTDTDELLAPGFENDDSEGEIDVVEELLVDNSISNSENELSDNEASDNDDPLFPCPPPEPPDAEFDFEPNSGEEILAVINDNDELECFDTGGDIDVSINVEDDDYFPFMFLIKIFLPYLIYPEVFPLLLFAESEDTIFDPGISV